MEGGNRPISEQSSLPVGSNQKNVIEQESSAAAFSKAVSEPKSEGLPSINSVKSEQKSSLFTSLWGRLVSVFYGESEPISGYAELSPRDRFYSVIDAWVESAKEGEDRQKAAEEIKRCYQERDPSLCIEDCGLHDLPDVFSQLSHVKFVYLSDNQLEQLPESLSKLPSLCSLDISNNEIRALSDGTLNNLQTYYANGASIKIGNNPLPKEIEIKFKPKTKSDEMSDWYQLANRDIPMESKTAHLQKVLWEDFLFFLKDCPEFQSMSTKKYFIQRVLHLLQTAIENKEMGIQIQKMLSSNSMHSTEKVSLLFSRIEAEIRFMSVADKDGNIEKNIPLLKGIERLVRLEQLVSNYAKNQGVDSLQIMEEVQHKLKSKLDIPIELNSTKENNELPEAFFEDIYQKIIAFEKDNPDHFHQWLITQQHWKNFLFAHHPNEVNKRKEQIHEEMMDLSDQEITSAKYKKESDRLMHEYNNAESIFIKEKTKEYLQQYL